MKTIPILFASSFIVIGLGTAVFGIMYLRKARSTLNWPTTEGKVVKSQVESWLGDDDITMYGVRVEYRYSVDGIEYTGQRVRLGLADTSSPKPHERVIERYPRGRAVAVAYSPQDSSDAVLERGTLGGAYVMLVFGLFMSVLAGLMLHSLLTSQWS